MPLTSDVTWLLSAAGSDTAVFELNVIRGDGATLSSDDLLVTSVGTPSTEGRCVLKLRAQPGILTVRMPASGKDSRGKTSTVHYHTVGMQGFADVRGSCELGEVVVEGPVEVTDFHDIAGQIAFRRPHDSPSLAEWIAACDERVVSILRMMSFALGRFVAWSVREVYVDRTLHECRFVGPRRHAPPAEPAFHFLDLQPALDLALSNHHLIADSQSGIGEAIDWLTPWHTFAEIRFLSAMTAFECLVNRNKALSSAPRTKVFKTLVRPRLEAVLLSSELRDELTRALAPAGDAEVDAYREELTSKLGDLNRKFFATRLESFLTRYDVPLDDLPVSIIELVQARNRVIHGTLSGASEPKNTVTVYADAIREVLRRALLAMLGFEGRFSSYMREPEWVTFRGPPTRRA